ncbi:thioredoxin-disulfide reductase [Tupanvirus soda lake]|uniref:Thioredoxin-disulfide reductase n=2 Tax=Tupanvirus TaxID=2094720 RepID=A0A6N1NN96_9VIRU|nr:thioredoxin-disulfide reductase [Tupanvirus soda lake]QKU35420.1 thioredoxin-disulfide reductase [Tupanvirus soda lake]
MVYNVVIIGGGCAGLTAGIYCARALLAPIIFADTIVDKGGLLVKTSIVENYPGFPKGINGFDLISNMEQQAIEYGATIIEEKIVSVNFSVRPFLLTDSSGKSYEAKSVIICTGSKPNKLHIKNEDRLWTKGISSCAVCDGALYRNKKIIVVGGGDSAMEEALFLTKFSNVTLVHRRSDFRASKVMQDRVINNPKINIIYDTVIDEIHGDNILTHVILRNVKSGKKTKMEVDGLFYGLGLTPNTELFSNQIECDSDGYIIRYRHPNGKYKTVTSVEGVFVAGDATDKKYKQAVVACGDGCKAALDVEKYLEEKHE